MESSALARYFLHIVLLDGSVIEDEEGFDLPDLESRTAGGDCGRTRDHCPSHQSGSGPQG